MPANVGSQTVTLLYRTIANSLEWNRRYVGIRKTGIYSGGWLSVVNSTTAQISSLVCEISDGDYQVRVKTDDAVNLSVSSATPYVVLRWSYGGTINDYMEILAVASPSTNDLVVGLCTFSGGGSLNGFSYAGRSNPSTKDLYLKVEPTGDTELRVRIRGGYYQTRTGSVQVPDQKSDLFTLPSSNSKVYLVYVDTDGSINIDSSGVEAASPSAPSYLGKLVLAEVTLTSTDTSITVDKIKDVRPFVSSNARDVDGTTIQVNSSGQLSLATPYYLVVGDSSEQASAQSSWTKLTFANTYKTNGVTIVDGVVSLPAGRMYRISYSVILSYYSTTTTNALYGEARMRVISGDSLWGLQGDDNNVSRSKFNDWSELDVIGATLNGSAIILPSSNTTLQLEVVTRNGATTFRSKVVGCSMSVVG